MRGPTIGTPGERPRCDPAGVDTEVPAIGTLPAPVSHRRALDRLTGDLGDELEGPVEVAHRQLGRCRAEQVGDGGRPVMAAVRVQGLALDGTTLDRRSQVLDGHGRQRRCA